MAEHFARSVLKISMAQICQNLGWNSVNSSPLEILVDILHRYLRTLAKSTHTFSEHYNRTEPNLDDLALAFKEMGISLAELEEYVNNVEPVPFVQTVPHFPIQRSNKLHFPRDGSREVQQRPDWIHPHLPLMYPEVERDEEPVFSPMEVVDPALQNDGTNGFAPDSGSQVDSPRPGSRRPLEMTHDTNFSTPKRQRLHSDEDGGGGGGVARPFREVVSVTMTAAGIISPVMEGRLPDTCTPSKGFEDSLPNSPVVARSASPASPLPPATPTCDNAETDGDVEPTEVVAETKVKVEEVVKVRKPPKLKEPKKVKKDNKENKKKKVLKLELLAKKRTVKLKGVGRTPKKKSGTAATGSGVVKTPKVGRPKGKSTKSKSDKNVKSLSDDVPLDLSKTPPKQSKKAKSPKGSKAKTKSPKVEKQVPGGQLASLLAKVSGIKVEKGAETSKTAQNVASLREHESHHAKDWPEMVFVENSPERLVIDDNDELRVDPRDKVTRLASLDACISAVIQRGLQDGGGPIATASSSSLAAVGSAHATHGRSAADFDCMSFPAKIKLEPRDVYDFTDDDDDDDDEHRDKDGGAVPVDQGTVAVASLPSPRKKKGDEKLESRSTDGKKSKSRSKDGEKKPKNKSKSKSPKHIKSEVESDFGRHRPRTPDVRVEESDSESYARLSATPMMMGLGSSSFANSINPFHPLSQIPPALLPFPMPAYPGSTPPSAAGGNSMSPRSQVPYPKLVDLADVAISKARHDGDFDVGRSKEKGKEREREKKKERREKKEKEKLKSKRKKEKAKEKSSSGKSVTEKERDKSKSKKDKVPKVKGKDRKEEKAKEKEKKKEKGKEKSKEKKPEKKKSKEKGIKKEKMDKPSEDTESDATSLSVSSGIPRLTFKLGSASTSEVPKIVIKNISVDSPSCSPVPPKEVSSPPRASPSPLLPVLQSSSSGKSHPKPQSKVHPVPPAPARTVITETVGTIIDDSGAKIWICPACTHPDDGSPMIGCDECDEWYHWVCVNIVVPPKEEEEWFCTRCLARKQNLQRRKKHRKEK